MKHGELFAGIGGFGLGADAAGIETVWHVEIDAKCQYVLRKRFPGTKILSDVRHAGSDNLERVNVISFGSPCQDLSIAGKREGFKVGTRSSLFFEGTRIISELDPDIAVWENVPGAFSSNNGRDFAEVLTEFQNIGARDVAWRVFDAQYFGVPQRRRRIFLIADFRGERAAEILFEREGGGWNTAPGREKRCETSRGIANTITCEEGQRWPRGNGSDNLIIDGRDMKTHNISPTLQSKKSGGYSLNYTPMVMAHGQAHAEIVRDGSPSLTLNHEAPILCDDSVGVRRLTPLECERLQGFPDGWTDGQSDSARYKQLGNAVAVPVVSWIMKRIKNIVGDV